MALEEMQNLKTMIEVSEMIMIDRLTMVLEEEMIIHLKVLEDKTQNNQEITVLETMRLEKMKKWAGEIAILEVTAEVLEVEITIALSVNLMEIVTEEIATDKEGTMEAEEVLDKHPN